MIVKSIRIEKFRAFRNVAFSLGRRLTALSGRNATQKTTLLGLIGQPFTISNKNHPMYGCKTIDGYNFRSQFKEKFKISPDHDIVGEHKWELLLHKGVYDQDSYAVESIARRQSGKAPSLRFWNAKSRARGAGYIQLPVYFLSLSRLFPIGESKKTQAISVNLTPEERDYCIDNYRTILSIQRMKGRSSVGIEKGSSSKIFAGVSDDTHDIFANSAGEGNVTRIILAVLSFKRLKEKYGKDYKGGILLIDELDATLHGFSQTKLVEYLWRSAEEYRIQIVFTTHSPIILKRLNKYQRKEREGKFENLPDYAYDVAIVYVEPDYSEEGERTVAPRNVNTRMELNKILDGINLTISSRSNEINIYCEDARAVDFVRHVVYKVLETNLDQYMNFVDVNLGWTNYIQLVAKGVPEFTNNIIILDGDVLESVDYNKPESRPRSKIVEMAGNFLFLPLVIERDLFVLMKDPGVYTRFEKRFLKVPEFTYEVCFADWPLEAEKYDTIHFKKWFTRAADMVGGQSYLFDFWCSEKQEDVINFVEGFVDLFNRIAEKRDTDAIPPFRGAS